MKKKDKTEQTTASETSDIKISQDNSSELEGEVVMCDCTTAPLDAFSLMQQQVEQLKQEVDEAKNNYLRSLADFDNFRKRQREEVARQISWAREALLLQMIGIADNLNRALTSADSSKDAESLIEGVNLILRQMQELLKKEGVEPIVAEGEEFNPELHDAMMRDTSGEHPENTVIQEFEKGYTMDGRVVRPAKVKVSVAE